MPVYIFTPCATRFDTSLELVRSLEGRSRQCTISQERGVAERHARREASRVGNERAGFVPFKCDYGESYSNLSIYISKAWKFLLKLRQLGLAASPTRPRPAAPRPGPPPSPRPTNIRHPLTHSPIFKHSALFKQAMRAPSRSLVLGREGKETLRRSEPDAPPGPGCTR